MDTSLRLITYLIVAAFSTNLLAARESIDMKELTKKAQAGDPQAQYELGTLYYTGQEVETNLELGANWFLKSAQQGLSKAQLAIGRCYFYGRGMPRDKEQGVGWYYEAALNDNVEAINALAECFYLGDGVEKNHREAIKWYSKAAANGERGAQFNIARILEKGDPSVRNPQDALKLYEDSARAGDSHAAYLVGKYYEEGKAVTINMNKAIQYYKAAAPESELARVKLAEIYARGIGVDRNPVEAYMWLELSNLTVENDPQAGQLKLELVSTLTPEQIKLAKSKAETYTKQHDIQQKSLKGDFGY